MKYLICLLSFFIFSFGFSAEEKSFSSSKMFSLSSKEMLFASKLSDVNRRHFCYDFSFKERSLAMQADDSLSPNQRVEQVYFSLHAQSETKIQGKGTIR